MTYQLAQQEYSFQVHQSLDPALYSWCMEAPPLFYVDSLSQHYLYATKELALICSEYKHLLYSHPKLDLLLTKLTDLLNEAASGDWNAMKEVENKGATTLLGVLDILEDLGLNLESENKVNRYARLEAALNRFYQDHFET